MNDRELLEEAERALRALAKPNVPEQLDELHALDLAEKIRARLDQVPPRVNPCGQTIYGGLVIREYEVNTKPGS